MINQVVEQVVAGMSHYDSQQGKDKKIPRKIAAAVSQ